MTERQPLRPPAALGPGSRVAVVAPSGPFEVEPFERGLELLRSRFASVVVRDDVLARSGFLAGDDRRRVAELQAAIDDDRVDAILGARGGYGATRLLGALDLSALRRRPKPLVGFSDITALHALWAGAGVRSIHGPMVATIGKPDVTALSRVLDMLAGAIPAPMAGLAGWVGGRARGVLLGGNLTVLHALLGTPAWPALEGAVLFLEDVGERPYRVDRMLTSLRAAGVLQGVRAFVLGGFTQCEAGPDGVRVEDVLRERLGDLGVAVLAGVPAGHLDDNRPLPLGALVEVDAGAGTMTFLGGACEAD